MDLKKNTCPFKPTLSLHPKVSLRPIFLPDKFPQFVCVCVCVCVCLESCFQVIPPQPHNNPVRSGLLLPCSVGETQAQGDGVTSFPESGGWKQYRSDPKPRALLAKQSPLVWEWGAKATSCVHAVCKWEYVSPRLHTHVLCMSA